MAILKPRRAPSLRHVLERLYRLQVSEQENNVPLKRFMKLWTGCLRGSLDVQELQTSGLCHSFAFNYLRDHLARRKDLEEVERLEAEHEGLLFSAEPTCDSASDPDLLMLLEPLDIQPPEPLPRLHRHTNNSALLHLHRTGRNGRPQTPKKEYFRCQHIRALKKSWRQMALGKLPGASIHQVQTQEQAEVWRQLARLYAEHEGLFISLSATETGPLTDGKSKPRMSEAFTSKSFNNQFCRQFFSSWEVQEYNRLFCDLVYDIEPDILCEKLKFKCCFELTHSVTCSEVWTAVKHFAQKGMLEELAVWCDEPVTEDAIDYLLV